MTNAARGEFLLDLGNGKSYVLLLNMGALAKIEKHLGGGTMADLIRRMMSLGADDMIQVILILARAGGEKDLTREQIETWPCTWKAYNDALLGALRASGFIGEEKATETPKTEGQ